MGMAMFQSNFIYKNRIWLEVETEMKGFWMLFGDRTKLTHG